MAVKDKDEFITSDKFWMCLVEGTNGCRYQHYNWVEARKEAERLSKQSKNIGKKVYLLEAVNCVSMIMSPHWEEVKGEGDGSVSTAR